MRIELVNTCKMQETGDLSKHSVTVNDYLLLFTSFHLNNAIIKFPHGSSLSC